MKVTTERMPKGILSINVELDAGQVERGLDRAAKRLSQKHQIPGFRKGKAPRFIIEKFFGRTVLIEEATPDLINSAFGKVLKQENITPVAQPQLESVDTENGFRFRIAVPVFPTATLPDYRAIQIPLEVPPITDEVLERAMERVRDKHVALRELDDPRPAQPGDQLTVLQNIVVEGEQVVGEADGEPTQEDTVVLEPGRLIDGIYDGLLGIEVGEEREITVRIDEDHENEQIRGKEATFNIQLKALHERVLPDWDEVPELEKFEGTLEELREHVRGQLENSSRSNAQRELFNQFVEQVVSETEFDIADAMVLSLAEQLFDEQMKEVSQYGVTPEQMLEYRGKTREEAINELVPLADQQIRATLVLRTIAQEENIAVTDEEVDAQIQAVVSEQDPSARAMYAQFLSQNRDSISQKIQEQKILEWVVGAIGGQSQNGTESAGRERNDHDDEVNEYEEWETESEDPLED